jgi:ABC-type sugar transport system ATPase subunit
MADIELKNVIKVYEAKAGKKNKGIPEGKRAVDNVSFFIPGGSFTVLVGPSGCGKTTMLRMIAGLEEITSGTIKMEGLDITNLDPGDRGIAMVFQNYALYPHMSVWDNIAFGLANATAICVGKAIGEDNLSAAKKYSVRFINLSILAGAFGAVIILIARPIAMSALNLTSQTQGYLSVMMYVMTYFSICQAINTTLVVGVFRAGGDTRFGLFLDVTTMWGGSILFGSLAAFVFKWSIPVIYIILMSDEVIKIPLTVLRYKKYKWLNNVTR